MLYIPTAFNSFSQSFFFFTDVRAYLEKTLNQRIMYIDGAMGTMIQRLRLEEDDFRGKNFSSSHDNLRPPLSLSPTYSLC